MNKTELLKTLSAQETSALVELLSHAYDEMTDEQRQSIFSTYAEEVLQAEAGGDPESYEVDGKILLSEIERFQGDSLSGAFYAPFRVNSRNFMQIPDQTREWFARLGDMLEASSALSEQGDHQCAVSCFGILYTLIDALEQGKEIVFADEVGTWMLHVDQKQCAAAYMTALAATATPEAFTKGIPINKAFGRC
jgi:hypothetical protein